MKRRAGTEPFAVVAGGVDFEPSVLAVSGFEALGGAHAWFEMSNFDEWERLSWMSWYLLLSLLRR